MTLIAQSMDRRHIGLRCSGPEKRRFPHLYGESMRTHCRLTALSVRLLLAPLAEEDGELAGVNGNGLLVQE
jgi:hypothetical protein